MLTTFFSDDEPVIIIPFETGAVAKRFLCRHESVFLSLPKNTAPGGAKFNVTYYDVRVVNSIRQCGGFCSEGFRDTPLFIPTFAPL
ncbi:hypothetical protein VUR80DRAFT_5365 [Thermomyces stellatus]